MIRPLPANLNLGKPFILICLEIIEGSITEHCRHREPVTEPHNEDVVLTVIASECRRGVRRDRIKRNRNFTKINFPSPRVGVVGFETNFHSHLRLVYLPRVRV